MSRPRALQGERLAEAQRRYRLWNDNRPYKIAMDLGVSLVALSKAIAKVRGEQKRA